LVGKLALGTLSAAVAVLTSPVTLAVAAVAGLTYAWARYTDSGRAATAQIKGQAAALREQMRPAIDKTREAFGATASALQRGDLGAALEVAGAGLEAAWTGFLNRAGKAWDDFVRPIEDAADDLFGWVRPMGREAAAELERLWRGATEAFDRVAAAGRRALDYVSGLWDRFGPRVMAAIEPVKELLVGLFAPVLAAVAVVREAWDGLDRNVMVTMTRLARTVDELWIRVGGSVENALKRVADAALASTGKALAAIGAVPGGPDVSKALESLGALRREIGAPIDIEARVRVNREQYDAVERIFREQADDAKRLRAVTDGFAALRRGAAAEAAAGRLDAAIDRANRFDFAGAAGALAGGLGFGLPAAPNVSVPNVSVKAATAGNAILGQQLGYGDQTGKRSAAALEDIRDGRGGLAAALAAAIASELMRVGG
jgi:hypothetical protein